MSAANELEAHAGALHAGGLGEFVASRNRLAAQVKAAGDAALAASIKALPKPSATAWAVDQLWWHERATVEGLFETAARLREALVGGAGPQEAARARAQHREQVALAAAHGADRLVAAGHNASIAIRRRLGTTLEALAALGRWPAPGPGCLAEDLDPPGFEALGGMPVMPRAEAPEAPSPVANRSDDDELARRIAAADAELRDAAALVDRRTREHDEAEQDRARADEDHRAAQQRVKEAEREAERTRNGLSAAETRAKRGEEALATAREAHERAKAALARLRANTRS